MTYAQGIAFRATLGYVSDGATDSFEAGGASATYPRTTAQGNIVGWEQPIGNTRDRSTTVDHRLAGIHYTVNSQEDFRFDLPAAGTYNIRIAAGDISSVNNTVWSVVDGTTVLGALTSGTNGVAGSFKDAKDTQLTAAAWPASNVAATFTFSSTICRIRSSSTAAADVIAYAYVESAASSSVALASASSANATATGAIAATAQLASASSASATAAGTLRFNVAVAGAASAQAASTASLKASAQLQSAAAATASAPATIATAIRLQGAANAVVTGSGTLSSQSAGLASNATCGATASGALSAAAVMSGTATASALASGTVRVSSAIAGTAAAFATASGNIKAMYRVAGPVPAAAVAPVIPRAWARNRKSISLFSKKSVFAAIAFLRGYSLHCSRMNASSSLFALAVTSSGNSTTRRLLMWMMCMRSRWSLANLRSARSSRACACATLYLRFLASWAADRGIGLGR